MPDDPRDEVKMVGGHTVQVTGKFTRPANTTQYAAGDVVADSTSEPTIITFAGCARGRGKTGVITQALLVDGANQATKAELELWLFTAEMTMDNDNAAFTPSDAELEGLVGIIDFGDTAYVGTVTAGADGNAVYQQSNVNLAFACGAAVSALYGVLVVRNAYTPVSDETFAIVLGVLQD